MTMQSRLSLITLGVANVAASRAFYEKLGWQASPASNEQVCFFQLNGIGLSLYGRAELANDATVANDGAGFDGITLAYNVPEKNQVAGVLAEAARAGAKIVKHAQDVFWGGHSGYFADPDGHLWEVAWNPFFPMDAEGNLQLPKPAATSVPKTKSKPKAKAKPGSRGNRKSAARKSGGT